MASRFASLVCLFSVAQGARTKRHAESGEMSIAGISVRGYRADAEDFVLFFKRGMDDATIKEVCKGHCKLMGHPNKGGAAFAQVRGLEATERVVQARPDLIDLLEVDEMDYMIPDIEITSEWTSWGLERIGLEGAPNAGEGVNIYVQDTGVRVTHTDFGGRASGAIDVTSGTVQECNGDVTCALDRQGHGSHCAGTAAGSTYGVASAAHVFAVKTLSDQGSGARSWQYAALDWMTLNAEKPTVVSMSLGGSGADPGYGAVIEPATEAGLVIVVAAGNSNDDSCQYSPAFHPRAITVGATDSNNYRAEYSNWGPCNNIMAPGSAITSAWHASDTDFKAISGTSMACPHVSGAAALLLSANPNLTRDGVLDELLQKSRKNFISLLKTSDPTEFLWVSAEPAPESPPTTTTEEPEMCPSFASSRYPDRDGDCRCQGWDKCSTTGGDVANCPTSDGRLGGYGGFYFLVGCQNCLCYGSLR